MEKMECPICKKKALFVGVHDDEGNYHGLVGCEYENDPWSGLSYALHHEGWGDCPLCTDGACSTMGGMLFDTAEEAISALSTSNEPLTLEQLREMDGEPVWVQTPGIPKYGRWVIVAGVDTEDGQRTLYCQGDYTCRDYGKSWVAYAYPPTHINREAWTAEWAEDGKCDHKPYRVRDAEKWKKYRCSKCGYKAGRTNNKKFCPSCGRAMTPGAWAELEKRIK